MADAGTDCSRMSDIFSAVCENVIDAGTFTTRFEVSWDGDERGKTKAEDKIFKVIYKFTTSIMHVNIKISKYMYILSRTHVDNFQ